MEWLAKHWAALLAVVGIFLTGLYIYLQLLQWQKHGDDLMLTAANVVVTVLLWAVLLAAIVRYWQLGADRIKQQGSTDKTPLWKWGLVFAIAISTFTLSVFGLYRSFAKPPQPTAITPANVITTVNVQDYIRKWSDDYSLKQRVFSSRELPPEAIFMIEITMGNGNRVLVERVKDHDTYIVFSTGKMTSQLDLDTIAKLSPEELDQIDTEMNLNLALTYGSAHWIDERFKAFRMEKYVPITSLTEETFMSAMQDVQKAMVVAQNTLHLGLVRARQKRTHLAGK